MNGIAMTLGAICLLGASASCADEAEPGEQARAAGVSSAGDGAEASQQTVGSRDAASGDCQRGTLESDFEPTPLAGAGVKDGALVAGNYVISTTYLQLEQEPLAQQRFGQVVAAIMTDLKSRDGLLAVSLGTSASCGSARTLSVWRDELAMLAFVAGDAHSRAIGAVSQLSRGGSIVTHWLGDTSQISWQSAAEHIGADDGPFY